MANHWLQTKRYVCTGCGARLLHDQMHRHVSFECPARRRRAPGAQDLCRNLFDASGKSGL